MDYRQILSTAGAIGGFSELRPIVDGRSLPRNPFDPDAPEISRDIPVMVGTCKDENTLFMALDPAFPHGTEDQVHERFKQMLHDKGDVAFALYKSLHPNDPPAYWLTSMATDMSMRMNSIRLAERKAAQAAAPVYMYRVDYQPTFLDGLLRSPHGTDVPLVFDTVATRSLEFQNAPEAKRLAATVSQAWINFARGGNPSQPGLPWPSYNAQTRETMLFNVHSETVADPDGQARQFWET